jgi:hypothetical protein
VALYDEVREPRVYQAILQAIGAAAHALDDIANATLIGKRACAVQGSSVAWSGDAKNG